MHDLLTHLQQLTRDQEREIAGWERLTRRTLATRPRRPPTSDTQDWMAYTRALDAYAAALVCLAQHQRGAA